jgi:ADP-heptose:LPS heptosyltransferase
VDDNVPIKLLLRSHLSPGDIVAMTSAVRDLHLAHPGQFQTDVDSTAMELWEHNPHITRLNRDDPEVRVIQMEYPLINHSNQRPVHFLRGYTDFLENELGIKIPTTRFSGDVHLSDDEKLWMNQVEENFGYRGKFWILIAGGKYDFTAKWWSPTYYQEVVNHFQGQIQFVQCGQQDHWHNPLEGTFNLLGRTSIREFVRLMYHAEGVLCPVTFGMHLAAAVPMKSPRLKPCVVVAGGREPPHWEAYPGHQFMHTIGALPCCATGGCWRSRCQLAFDGDLKDRENLCEAPVQVTADLRLPRCMMMIKPLTVIEAIERYSSFYT